MIKNNNENEFEFYDNYSSVQLYPEIKPIRKKNSGADQIVDEIEQNEISYQSWKKYKLAEDRERFYDRVIKGRKIVKALRAAFRTFVCGSLVAITVVGFDNSWAMDVKAAARKNMEEHPYQSVSQVLDNVGYAFEYPAYEYGTSSDIKLIERMLNQSITGDWIYELCDKYGVDPYVFASVYNYEHKLYDYTITKDDVEERVKLFRNNMDTITQIFDSKYEDMPYNERNKAILLCTIQAQNYGVSVIEYIINNYELSSSSNEYFYGRNFMDAVESIHNDPQIVFTDSSYQEYGDPDYIDTIIRGVCCSDSKFKIKNGHGEYSEVNFCWLNDWKHLIVNRPRTL